MSRWSDRDRKCCWRGYCSTVWITLQNNRFPAIFRRRRVEFGDPLDLSRLAGELSSFAGPSLEGCLFYGTAYFPTDIVQQLFGTKPTEFEDRLIASIMEDHIDVA